MYKRPTSSVYAKSFQGNQTQNNPMKKEGLSNATRGQAVAADFKQDLPAARWGHMATVVFMFLLAKIM